MKLNLIANIFGTSGFASHGRQFANALAEQGVEVRLETQLVDKWEQLVNDAELLMINREFSHDMITIFIGQPQFLSFYLADNPKTVIPFVIWEGSHVPLYWIEHLCNDKIQMIFVPSEHVKKAIMNTEKTQEQYEFLKDKIKIVPHGIDLSIFNNQHNNNTEKNKPFVFFANKGWSSGANDRGGIQYLIQAYVEEFTNKDDVELRIKINPAYNQTNWDFKVETEKLGLKKKKNSPEVKVCNDIVNFKIMPSFYIGNVFVSPTMSEGYNLPCLEAMAMSMPVITTNFGGQTDFVNKDNGWLIDYDLVNVTWDKNFESIKWAKPDIRNLRIIMRYCYDNRDVVKEKSKKALVDAQKLTWSNSAKTAIELLKEIK